MALPANATPIGSRMPSKLEREGANQLRKLLAAHLAGEAKLKIVNEDTKVPVDLVLTPAMTNLLMEVFRHIGKGDAVTLMPVSQMLTTQQAADVLNVSRPHLISLLEQGKIEFTLVGRHRRIEADKLLAYKAERDNARSEALASLAALDGETL